MLSYLGGERRHLRRTDPNLRTVSRRQVRLARDLAPLTGLTPRQLLDYHRADDLLRRR